MDMLCESMSNLNLKVENVVNIGSLHEHHIDGIGIYKEIVTPIDIYRIYTCGRILSRYSTVKWIEIKNIGDGVIASIYI